jgi:hypothetical protein
MRGAGAAVEESPLAPAHIADQRRNVNAPIQHASVGHAARMDSREMRMASHIERHGAGAQLLASILADRR